MRVSALHVRALVEAVGMKGVSTQAFLRSAGLEAQRLADPYGWFSVEEFDPLLSLAVELTDDEAFGLHWGEYSPMTQYDLLPPLVSQARSLRDGIQAILRFQGILADRPEVEFHDRSGRARFELSPIAATPRGRRLRSEMTAVSLLRMLKVVGSEARPVLRRVAFAHACPDYRDEYQRIFGVAVSFDQPVSCLEFQYGTLDSPAVFRNEELHDTLAAQAERVLQRVTAESTHAERLKRLIERALPAVLPIADAARSLGTSERSLRRRLVEEGVSYSQLVMQVQIDLACGLLDDPKKSLKEVAHETGFAGSSAFHRAFKRSKGTSPAQYRARATAKRPS